LLFSKIGKRPPCKILRGGGRLIGMKRKLTHTYEDIISMENLLLSWQGFLKGKKNRKDVQEFQMNLMDNILSLHKDLMKKTYKHSDYVAFNISDPKPRNIHKATVEDRLLHHAIYRKLYPFFDRTFIADSYSCRKKKGTHKAMKRFQEYGRKVSKNNTRTCYVLKCDIRKFFASINHEILIKILKEHIEDEDIISLLKEIIGSFETEPETGLPLGNLTSQLLVNIYMNKFDQHVKHKLKIKYYIRYADDFVFLSTNKEELQDLIPQTETFLEEELKLKLHPQKVFIKTLSSGVDFLGWVHFPHHRVLRTTTKRRMIKNYENGNEGTKESYLGLLKHGDAYKLKQKLNKNF